MQRKKNRVKDISSAPFNLSFLRSAAQSTYMEDQYMVESFVIWEWWSQLRIDTLDDAIMLAHIDIGMTSPARIEIKNEFDMAYDIQCSTIREQEREVGRAVRLRREKCVEW